mmetsp:Transcript_17539/g.38440  ORF Transcript_17539/g.38440 Transcript_17539/m.38440 type:complete len:306 (+) Transcript_17539:163-1080(+)
MVASEPINITSRPDTTPMPVTTPPLWIPPPYISHAAKAESSRKSVPGSMIFRMRSRTRFLPRLECRFLERSGPPWRTMAKRLWSSSHVARLCASRFSNVGSPGLAFVLNGAVSYGLSSAESPYHGDDEADDEAGGLGTIEALCTNSDVSSSTMGEPVASRRASTVPMLTCAPCSTRTSRTRAERSGATSLSIFMAVMTRRTCPAATTSLGLTLKSVTCPGKGATTSKIAAPSSEGGLAGIWSFWSSTHVVCTPPASTSGCSRILIRKSRLMSTPRTTNSERALRAALKASGKVAAVTINFARRGS